MVYAEMTPNPTTMKFVSNVLMLKPGVTVEYFSADECSEAPLPQALFQFPFVKSIFVSGNYVSITRNESVQWGEVMGEIRDFVRKFLASGKDAILKVPEKAVPKDSGFKETVSVHTQHAAPQNETENKIIEVLEEYIRPAVEQDGGLITFQSFQDGIVKVQLRGACSGCPSSTLTLKAGIEGLLKRMVPGVEEVVAENQ